MAARKDLSRCIGITTPPFHSSKRLYAIAIAIERSVRKNKPKKNISGRVYKQIYAALMSEVRAQLIRQHKLKTEKRRHIKDFVFARLRVWIVLTPTQSKQSEHGRHASGSARLCVETLWTVTFDRILCILQIL